MKVEWMLFLQSVRLAHLLLIIMAHIYQTCNTE